jgi:hypothetical protein
MCSEVTRSFGMIATIVALSAWSFILTIENSLFHSRLVLLNQ